MSVGGVALGAGTRLIVLERDYRRGVGTVDLTIRSVLAEVDGWVELDAVERWRETTRRRLIQVRVSALAGAAAAGLAASG